MPKQGHVNASRLNRLVRIEQETGTDDGQGGETSVSWTTVLGCALVPAAIRPLSGYEAFTASQVYPGVNYEIKIRFRRTQNISAKMRVIYGTRIFNIRGVTSIDEENQTIKLMCEELQAKGSS